MTSSRKAEANRANAKLSTGPKSAEGQARSAQNARRHGLRSDAGVGHDAALVERLQRALAGPAPSRAVHAAAHEAALAYAHLLRVQSAKSALYRTALQEVGADLSDDPASLPPGIRAAALIRVSAQLLTLDGYERKAISRRKGAIRRLEALMVGESASRRKAASVRTSVERPSLPPRSRRLRRVFARSASTILAKRSECRLGTRADRSPDPRADPIA